MHKRWVLITVSSGLTKNKCTNIKGSAVDNALMKMHMMNACPKIDDWWLICNTLVQVGCIYCM